MTRPGGHRSLRLLLPARVDAFAPRPQPLQILSTAAGLARGGARVDVVLDAPGAPGARGAAALGEHLGWMPGPRATVHLLGQRHPGVRGLRRRLLLRRLLRDGVEVILCRDISLTAALGRSRGRRRGAGPLLVHEWHAVPTALGQRDEGEAAAAAAADLHVCVSEGLARHLRERLPVRGPIHVVPNGCHLDRGVATAALSGLAAARRVLVAGLFRGPTDHELLARVARRLPDGLSLTVAGTPPDPGAWSRGVDLLGVLPPAAVPPLLPGCLAQLALYRRDLNTERFASPLKVLQAMASGVPLVATDLPTVRSLVEHGRSALLVPPGDAGAVADALATLAAHRDLARRLAGAALDDAAGRTWDHRGRTLLSLLEGEVTT